MTATKRSRAWHAALLVLLVAVAGCATQPFDSANPGPATSSETVAPDRRLQDRLLALDPEHISDADVREVLAKGSTPRIILLHGGVYPVHLVMYSFGQFLTGMGYPEAKIRDPGTGSPMPGDFARRMSPAQLQALVAFLLAARAGGGSR